MTGAEAGKNPANEPSEHSPLFSLKSYHTAVLSLKTTRTRTTEEVAPVVAHHEEEQTTPPGAYPTPYVSPLVVADPSSANPSSPVVGSLVHNNLWNCNYPTWFPFGGEGSVSEMEDRNGRWKWRVEVLSVGSAPKPGAEDGNRTNRIIFI